MFQFIIYSWRRLNYCPLALFDYEIQSKVQAKLLSSKRSGICTCQKQERTVQPVHGSISPSPPTPSPSKSHRSARGSESPVKRSRLTSPTPDYILHDATLDWDIPNT